MIYSNEFINFMKQSEGFRSKVYRCPAGKLTIGYGLNLEDRGVTEVQAEYLMIDVIRDVESNLRGNISFWNDLDKTRQEVLIDMAYNMGVAGLMQFRKTLAHIANRDYENASEEMLRSRWASQVGNRATKLSNVMKTGTWT
jgi:lysozyme